MWVHKSTIAIGGLENIGYAPNQDILIVLSTQGQGLFDCKKGEIIGRLRDDMNWWNKFDQDNNSITGFDVVEGITIYTSGLYGGDTLAKVTFDNWTIIATEPEPDDKPFENYTVKRIYLVSPDNEKLFVGKDGACELRAFGFSETGQTFVIGLSCEIMLFSRA